MPKKLKIQSIIPARDFLKAIEDLVKDKKMTYMDAVMHFCQVNSFEVETAAALIKTSTKMKKKLEDEARALHLLKKGV